METQRFVRKCCVTGTGINEGWYIDGEWYSTIELANAKAVEMGYKDFADMYQAEEYGEVENDSCYWSSFEDIDGEIEAQGEFYLADGTTCFGMQDERGNTAIVILLDDVLTADECRAVLLMNGVNDAGNFSSGGNIYFYAGCYFFGHNGGYLVQWSNQEFETDDLGEMKSFIKDNITELN